jgi:hypothetical protein
MWSRMFQRVQHASSTIDHYLIKRHNMHRIISRSELLDIVQLRVKRHEGLRLSCSVDSSCICSINGLKYVSAI